MSSLQSKALCYCPPHRMKLGRLTAPQCWRDRFLDIYNATGIGPGDFTRLTGVVSGPYREMKKSRGGLNPKPYHPKRSTLEALSKLEVLFAEDIARYRAKPSLENFEARRRQKLPPHPLLVKKPSPLVEAHLKTIRARSRRVRHTQENLDILDAARAKWRFMRYAEIAARAASGGAYVEIVESWSHN